MQVALNATQIVTFVVTLKKKEILLLELKLGGSIFIEQNTLSTTKSLI